LLRQQSTGAGHTRGEHDGQQRGGNEWFGDHGVIGW
jgi:hypothetical protein